MKIFSKLLRRLQLTQEITFTMPELDLFDREARARAEAAIVHSTSDKTHRGR
jgi:hypothetical protein